MMKVDSEKYDNENHINLHIQTWFLGVICGKMRSMCQERGSVEPCYFDTVFIN